MLQIIIETKRDSCDKEFESSEENDTGWPIFKSSDIYEKIDNVSFHLMNNPNQL